MVGKILETIYSTFFVFLMHIFVNCICLACIVVILCVFVVPYVYLLYYVYCCYYFRCRTADQKSVSRRSCDWPPRHRLFLVSLCLQANAEMVPKFPSCYYMPLMQPFRIKFPSYFFFHICLHVKKPLPPGDNPIAVNNNNNNNYYYYYYYYFWYRYFFTFTQC